MDPDHNDPLNNEINRLQAIFNRMDSDADGEVSNAAQLAKRSFKKINKMVKEQTGDDPGLSFQALFEKANQEPGVDPDKHEQVVQENEQLRVANEQFARTEQVYQKRIQELENSVNLVGTVKQAKQNVTQNTIAKNNASAVPTKRTSTWSHLYWTLPTGVAAVYTAYEYPEYFIAAVIGSIGGTFIGGMMGAILSQAACESYRNRGGTSKNMEIKISNAFFLGTTALGLCSGIAFGVSTAYNQTHQASPKPDSGMQMKPAHDESFHMNAGDQTLAQRLDWSEALAIQRTQSLKAVPA